MLIPLLFASLAQAHARTPDISAWEKLKYGMFIHFGMSTFDQSEINDGKSAPSVYHPTHLDVRQWIHVAKEAGMKYAVLTAKHTAGFCLWPSGDYDIDQSPVKTDVVAEFMKACKEEGIEPGIYYCVLDGHNEDGVKWDAPVGPGYFALIEKHLTQLHTRYPGIMEQWIDIPGKLTPVQRTALYDLVKRLSPHCLVLMNLSNWDRPGTTMPEGAWPTDLAVGERNPPPAEHDPLMTVEGKQYYVPLECCDTLEDNWFWVKGDAPRPLERLARIWQTTVGRGANLLLDVPPDMTGRIPESSIKRLMELKAWVAHPTPFPVSLTRGMPATASNIYKNDPQFDPKFAVDGNDATRWATDDDQHSAWLEVDLGTEKTFDRTYITEAYYPRVQRFEVQRKVGDQWETICRGSTIGAHMELRFKPVSARYVRLHILESTVGPTIPEFDLYER
ncbi:MAG TPA: alpha-L-fucosidase [Fimbriimonadaceae bacterium]|nr:alpha-L-fucosidase [Fimbriimonadaceae bacterium]